MSDARSLTLRLLVSAALVSSFGCAPPSGARARLSACDGGACGDAAATPPPWTGEAPDGPYLCAPGVYCDAWQECLDGACVGDRPIGACADSADCRVGERCASGRCVPEEPNTGSGCAASSDCGPGAACVSGVCIEGCAADADCTAGERCVSGTCRTPSTTTECTSDADCPGAATCVAGHCDSSSGGGSCLDEHCH